MKLDIQLQITVDRDVKKGEILKLSSDEIYMKHAYMYGESTLLIEATVRAPYVTGEPTKPETESTSV